MKKGQNSVISTILLIFIGIVAASMIIIFASGYISIEKSKQKILTSIKDLEMKFNVYSDVVTSYGYILNKKIDFIVETQGNVDDDILSKCRPLFVIDKGDSTISYISTERIPRNGESKQYTLDFADIGITEAKEINKIDLYAKCEKVTSKLLDTETIQS
ncbi:MAG: hypothetical protein QXW97_01275 [Candidatus Pacearchaeota archaeon]